MTSNLDEQLAAIFFAGSGADRFAAALRTVLASFGAQTGTIHRLNTADAHLYLVAASDGIPEAVLAVTRCIPLGKGIAGEAAATGRAVSICNLQTDQSGSARPGAKATGVHGALCVPIFRGERITGTLGIGTAGARTFTDDETAMLIATGRIIAPHLDLLAG